MSGEINTAVVGNLTDTPELRFTPSGAAVCKFRVASTPRKFRDGKWVDDEPSFLTCTAWRHLAENIAESLSKGDRVVVVGTIAMRQYETNEGEKRTVWEMQADAVGPELTFAVAKVTKSSRSNGGGGQRGDDEWAGASKERPAQAQGEQGAARQAAPATGTAPSANTQRQQQAAAPPSNDW